MQSMGSRAARPGGATYRHLLSPSSLTPQNPLRVIALVDIDAAYAQFEQVRLGLPPERPLVQLRGAQLKNIAARKFGIKRFHTIDEAKKMCPDLYVQHVATYRDGEAEAGYWDDPDPRTHKVSLDVYRRESQKIIAVFNSIVTKGEIEKASIDEAFLDLTLMVFDRLLARFPYLAAVPDGKTMDSPLPPPPGIDWSKAGNVLPVDGETDDTDEPNMSSEDQVDSVEADPAGYQDTWEDWALCLGAEIMAELRAAVFKELKYTCSAGISHGKAMAKLSAGHKKPNNQTVLRSAAVAAFLRDQDFTEIRMLGGKLGTAIAEQFQVKTVGDLLTIPLEELQGRFGEEAVWVYNAIRGIDHSEVTPRLATKSMLASKNTRPPVTTPEQGVHWLGILAGELFVRLREAREIAPGLWPKSIVLGHRTGIETSRHRQAPFPYSKNLSAAYISKHAEKLWAEVCQPMSRGGMKLNNMSLSFSGLERLEEGQKGIEGFFAPKKDDGGNKPIFRVEGTVTIASAPDAPTPIKKPQPRLPTLHTKKRSPLDGFFAKRDDNTNEAGPSRPKPRPDAKPTVVDLVADDDEDEEEKDVPGQWKCPQCGAIFTADRGSADQAGSVEAQKQEHEDYHFARSLQDGPSPKRAKTGKEDTQGTKGKVKKKEGLKAFFAPRPATKR